MNLILSSSVRICVAALAVTAAAAIASDVTAQGAQLANPASQNCLGKGGQVVIEKNPRGGAFGVCTFDDDRQCEEWALLRGECPKGGIKVTGYATPAARYCAITGGTYAVTGASNMAQERGTCSFANGRKCNAAAYFEGRCSREAAPATPASGLPAPVKADFTCAGGTSIDAVFINTGNSRVRLTFSDGRKITLPQAMSADGARYANKAETIVFWNKGNTAFVQENGQTTYADCVAKR